MRVGRLIRHFAWNWRNVFGTAKEPCPVCGKPFRPVSDFHEFCCYGCRMAAYRDSMGRSIHTYSGTGRAGVQSGQGEDS